MACVELGGVLVYGAKVMLPRWDLINLWGTYSTPTSDVWDGTIHIKRERRTITVTTGLWSIMGLCVASKYLTGIRNAFIFDCPISFLMVFFTSVCLPNKKIERPRACRLRLVHLILNCRCCPWAQFVIWTGWTNIAGCFYLHLFWKKFL